MPTPFAVKCVRENGDVARSASLISRARQPLREFVDPQRQRSAEPLLQFARRPFDQPWALLAADREGPAAPKEGADGVIAHLADVKSLQRLGWRSFQRGARLRMGHRSRSGSDPDGRPAAPAAILASQAAADICGRGVIAEDLEGFRPGPGRTTSARAFSLQRLAVRHGAGERLKHLRHQRRRRSWSGQG
jgi:hypothetical protein